MGFGPQVVDLDRDGNPDMLSGSYPGELYLARGRPDGTFESMTTLPGAEGQPIRVGSAAAPFAADWDADGDVDLVVGDIQGHVWWLANQSGGNALEFGPAVKLEADGAVIRVGHGDAGPVLADWDGDGRLDLVVGCGDGSVLLYRTEGTDGGPHLAAPETLVAAAPGGMSLAAGAAVRAGARAKPCVVDWNGDGRLDLLFGDVLVEQAPAPEATPADAAEAARRQARLRWLQERYQPLVTEIQARVLTGLGIEVGAGGVSAVWANLTPEQRAQYSAAFREELAKDLDACALSRLLEQTSRAVQASRPPTVVHGHVWVRLGQ